MAQDISPDDTIEFNEVKIIETEETAWIRVGDSFVDVSRILAVGVNDGGKVEILLEDTAFVSAEDDTTTLEDVMTLIVEATTMADHDDE